MSPAKYSSGVKQLIDSLKAGKQHSLYFDGSCPLCKKEMAVLRRLKNSQLRLLDIHEVTGLSQDQKSAYLAVLHLQLPNGDWLKGVDANVTAWSFTPIGFLWMPLRWKFWRRAVDRLYLRWAENRYCRTYACQVPKKFNDE